jgi:pyruvate dehydrogenase E2 component (dihydrolipoamide acetyltransferase)
MVVEVILPKLGQTMEEGIILEWYKKEGDAVKKGEALLQVESDKAALDSEAPGSGILKKILYPAGSKVPVLVTIGLIAGANEDISQYKPTGGAVPALAQSAEKAPEKAPEVVAVEAKAEVVAQAIPGRQFVSPRARMRAKEEGVELSLLKGSGPDGRIEEKDVLAFLVAQPKATPVARKMAAETGLSLAGVSGTGPGGRVSQEDVERLLKQKVAPAREAAPVAAVQPITTAAVPLTGLRGIIAKRMAESHQTTAPVTLTMEVDATALVALREQLKAALAEELGFNLGYNDLLAKIAARALKEFPYMNVRLVEENGRAEIRQLGDVHVGMAVDSPRGLLVPVLRNVDIRSVKEIARELRELVARARDGKSLPDDLSGGHFTITNLGMFDIDAFTPIINLPECAILGVGRIAERPAVVNGQICARSRMWLSLTFDHRLVDGAPAARFLQRIKQYVEQPYLLLA